MSNLSVNAIRFLGIDAINKANSGHPGVVMGAAPMAYSLFTKQLRINPAQPNWINRDRFILSAGHGSMLLYALLHLSGFEDVSMDEIKSFRQWGSKTPGHPEFGHTAGIDATTGPLGQGISTATGFAQAERFLAAKYNREGYNIFDHYTYVICGDGDLMEGVSSEAASYAGLQKLDKLVVLYDSNDINLDGETKDSFTESVRDRYNAYGWHTALVEDGTDLEAIHAAIETAKASGKPSLIEVKTVIGYGSPNKQGTNAVHGAPLGADETAATRQALGWDYEPFEIPEQVYADFKEHVADRGASAYEAWTKLVADYKEAHPELAAEVEAIIDGRDPVEVTPADFPALENGFSQATRNSSQDALNVVAAKLPTFLGGSADLAHSNMTYIKTDGLQDDANRLNRNIQFGVREFAMGTILNGMALHGGVIAACGTFFVFSDYMKPAIRMAALMELPVKFVWSHDAFRVGEDGPTHEPVEQEAQIRLMEKLQNHHGADSVRVLRPSDVEETTIAWRMAMENTHTPTALILSRQNINDLPAPEGKSRKEAAEAATRGGYIVLRDENPEVVLIANGSEVSTLVEGAALLRKDGIRLQIVAVPSEGLFRRQSQEYQDEVLPRGIRRFGLTAGLPVTLQGLVGDNGAIWGLSSFGFSAPYKVLDEKLGFTPDHVYKEVKALLSK